MYPVGLPQLAALQGVDPLPTDLSIKSGVQCRRHLLIKCRGTAREWKIEQNWELGQPPPELKYNCSLLGSDAFSGLGLTAVEWHIANKAQHQYNTPGSLEWEVWETICLMGRGGEKIVKMMKEILQGGEICWVKSEGRLWKPGALRRANKLHIKIEPRQRSNHYRETVK